MDDLARWLGECLDADERGALAATQHRWIVSERKTPASADSPSGDPFWVAADEGFGAPAFQFKDKRDAEFIAVWDPARVLREIDAKRQLLDRYEELRAASKEQGLIGDVTEEYQDFLLRLLASVYADRDGYREEWSP